MDYQSFLETTFLGISVQNYALAIGFLLVGWLFSSKISSLFIRLISQLFKKSDYKLSYQEYKEHVQKPLNFFLLLVFVFLASNFLKFPEEFNLAPVDQFGLRMILLRGYQLLMAYAITRVALKVVVILGEIMKKKAAETSSRQDDQLIPFAIEIFKILIVIIAVLIILSAVFSLNVGSLVAGLGIGGLAIALAAKESLENLFGSFTIFFDKPFVVGDMIKVGNVEGIVEKVVFRSTRIRTLEKSYLTLPNKSMVNAELDNFSLRTFRRVKLNVGLLYGTKLTVMKGIVDDIKNYLDNYAHTNQDAQVRFMNFGSSSLDIMVLYYIDTMDWNLYLEYKEEINYKIMEIVEEKGGDFAFPTQTIHLQKENTD
jgi:MscS family membrane protein